MNSLFAYLYYQCNIQNNDFILLLDHKLCHNIQTTNLTFNFKDLRVILAYVPPILPEDQPMSTSNWMQDRYRWLYGRRELTLDFLTGRIFDRLQLHFKKNYFDFLLKKNNGRSQQNQSKKSLNLHQILMLTKISWKQLNHEDLIKIWRPAKSISSITMQTFRYSIWRPEHNDIHLKIREKEEKFTIFDQRDFKIFEFGMEPFFKIQPP